MTKTRCLTRCFVCSIFLSIFTVYACSSHHQSQPIYGPYVPPNSVQNLDLSQVLYPHWFVLPGYEGGGSSFVVVFTSDGHIWTRKRAEHPLTLHPQTWFYDPGKKMFSLSEGEIVIGGKFDYSWDHQVYFDGKVLSRGHSDYSPEKLVPLFVNVGKIRVINSDLREEWPNSAVLKFRLDHTFLLATGNTQESAQEFIQQWPHLAKINASWEISPLGDQLLFDLHGIPGYIFPYFQGNTLCIDIDYTQPIYSMIKTSRRLKHIKHHSIKTSFRALPTDQEKVFLL